MNWDAIAALAELLGAIAVLASLVYLATQIRQNTQMVKSSIRQQLTLSTQNHVYKMVDEADVLAKAAGGEELTPAEVIKLRQLIRAAFRGYEDYAYQHKHGLFDSSEWTGRLETIRATLAMPFVRERWLQPVTSTLRTCRRLSTLFFRTHEAARPSLPVPRPHHQRAPPNTYQPPGCQ